MLPEMTFIWILSYVRESFEQRYRTLNHLHYIDIGFRLGCVTGNVACKQTRMLWVEKRLNYVHARVREFSYMDYIYLTSLRSSRIGAANGSSSIKACMDPPSVSSSSSSSSLYEAKTWLMFSSCNFYNWLVILFFVDKIEIQFSRLRSLVPLTLLSRCPFPDWAAEEDNRILVRDIINFRLFILQKAWYANKRFTAPRIRSWRESSS
jgi:hypothetical protein